LIKKIKEKSQGATHGPAKWLDFALSKNQGRDVKYRIRKQQEREANEHLKEFLEYPDDEDRADDSPSSRPL
jgi:hypothetical protein